MNWFDYRESQLYQWVRKNTFDRISQGQPESFGAWKERSEAVDAVKTYLSDPPSKNHHYQPIVDLTQFSNHCIRSWTSGE